MLENFVFLSKGVDKRVHIDFNVEVRLHIEVDDRVWDVVERVGCVLQLPDILVASYFVHYTTSGGGIILIGVPIHKPISLIKVAGF